MHRIVVVILLTLGIINESATNIALGKPVNAARFCGVQPIRDYEAPLREMPRLNRPPAAGKPLGHTGVRVERYGSPLVIGNGSVGISLSNESQRMLRPLKLQTKTTLSRIDASGHVIGGFRKKHQEFEAIQPLTSTGVTFNVSGQPAFYRVDMEIRSPSEEVTRFSENFRVLHPTRQVHLAVNASTIKSGEKLRFHFENFGASLFAIGLPFVVEQHVDGVWVQDKSLTPSGFPMPAFGLSPGRVSTCQAIVIPPTASPGAYRVSKELSAISKPRSPRQIKRWAEFKVEG